MVKMNVITTRIENKYFDDLKLIEKEEHTERAVVIRKLLSHAIKDWKMKKALALLREHKITMRKAATLANVSYAEMLDSAAEAGVSIGYSLNELQKDRA